LPAEARVLTGNRILDALPSEEIARLRIHLEPATLALRQVVARPDEAIDFVYFPVKGALSVMTLLRDGSSVEVGTIGSEGLLGLSALLGDGISIHEVIVQGAGEALRGPARAIRHEFDRSPPFRDAVAKLSQLVLAEASQNAACNGRHSLAQRCARWLLRMHDAVGTDHFPLSQEFLATMLGVQRTGVTAAALELRRKNLIDYQRGKVAILNGKGLEAAACECYGIMKHLRDRFLRD